MRDKNDLDPVSNLALQLYLRAPLGNLSSW